ncbi:MAG: ribosomal protein S18-alanine N-acetyltransferase [Thiotrichales bacterium]|nr:ribosomal protein S18-alanine N-acetyltransferase [Thiotrichales bacterium]
MNAVARELPDVGFRPMRESDLDEVLSIEREAYEFPWSREIFRDCLRVGYRCRVLELDGAVNAYGMLQIAAGRSRLLNLCVRRRLHRRGLGRRLLTLLIELARSHRTDSVVLEVRPSNAAARGLYESMGFAEVGVSRGYYPARTGREDAMILALTLS